MKNNTELSSEIDPEKQARARELSKISRFFSISEIIFSFIYFAIAISSGFSVWLRIYSVTLTDIWFLQLSLYCIVFFAIPSVLTFPVSLYEGYFLQKKFGLLKQGFGGWLLDEAKKLLLSAVIGLPLIALLYLALEAFPSSWWFLVSVGYFLLSILGLIIVPVIIMPMFAKYTPVEDSELIETLNRLAAKADTRIEGVYRWGLGEKTTQANAALTGFGKTRRIIISDTMLDNYTAEEIETVLAHELGHHVNKDIPRMMVMGTLLTALSLYLCSIVLIKATDNWGLNGLGDFANLPLLMIILTAFSLVTMPLVNTYSRHREFQADLYSFRTTGKPVILANALKKLTNQNLSEVSPPKIIEYIFYSHPSVERRVKFAENYVSQSK